MTKFEIINELYRIKNAHDTPIRFKPIMREILKTIISNEAIRRGRWVEDLEPWNRCSECGAYLHNAQLSSAR